MTAMDEDSDPGSAVRELGAATWTSMADGAPRVLLVPLGSCEQHGPHLPLDTDTTIATAVARIVAAQRDDTVVAPALGYGSSGEHQSFPGTLSIGTEALITVLVELGRSAFPSGDAPSPYRALVFVNGHAGNLPGVRRAVEVLVGEGRPVSSWAPSVAGGDAHAGATETSIMLAIAPGLVGDDRPVGATAPLAELLPSMRSGGVRTVSANGVVGDASGASTDDGRSIVAALVDDLLRTVEGLGVDPSGA